MNTQNLSHDELTEMVDSLKEAQKHLFDAVYIMEYIARCTKDELRRTYVIAPISIATSEESQWMSYGHNNLDNWIEALEEVANETECDEDEDEDDDLETEQGLEYETAIGGRGFNKRD